MPCIKDGEAEGITDGFVQDCVEIAVRDRRFEQAEEPARVFAVKQQIVGLQNGHKPCVLKGHHTTGRRAAGEQDKPPVRALADQRAQRLQLAIVLLELKIVN